MFASVTRLRVRTLMYLPSFLWHTRQSQAQVERAAGFVGGRLLVDRHWTFWTLTVWEAEKAMKAFRGSGAHAQVMPHLANWCDEAAYAHWQTTGETVPTWPEAYQHLLTTGKLSRVHHPSPAHEAKLFVQPRLQPLVGADLKPKKSAAA
jgi:uncharacterized protein DUF3291